MSDHPSSYVNQSISVTSPNNLESTPSYNNGKNNVREDLAGSAETRKKEFEDELTRLRNELTKYNQEE